MEQDVVRNEDWFLEQLGTERIEPAPLMKWLASRHAEDAAQAISLAELLQDTLVGNDRREEALSVLMRRAAWAGNDSDFRKACVQQAVQVLGSSPENRAMIENAGFDSEFGAAECFRRLNVLRALAPDVLCYDKTWGFGIVRKVDWFYKRVDIDFEKKPGHQMSFAYAAETLDILGDGHILALRYRDPDGLAQLIKDEPAEVVRITLRSMGEMPIARLQEFLVPAIVAEDDWKRFWDGARKVLKKDPLAEVPTKRTEPLRLLDKEKGYDEEWFGQLAGERKMERILELVHEFLAVAAAEGISDDQKEILANRLAFVIKGAGDRHAGLSALAMLAARDLGVAGLVENLEDRMERCFDPELFLTVTQDIPAKEIGRFLSHLHAVDKDRLLAILLAHLPELTISTLNEAMDMLLREGLEERCAEIFRDLTVENQTADVEALYWLMRRPEYMEKWKLGVMPDLAFWALRALDYDHCGEKLKTQNQLRTRFEDKEWLQSVLEQMNPGLRTDFLIKIRESTGWSSMDRRSLLGFVVKLYPELQDVVSAKKAHKEASVLQGPITSMRSYHERQAQLEKIVQKEIPEVAKEIGIARSYGDLRENFEFKAAKDKQALLMRRRAEFEQMLQTTRPTTFDDMPTNAAGAGTTVTLEFPDGARETYVILGVWDRDETLGIISCESSLARALQGATAGQELHVPTEHGEAACKVVDVTGLSAEVKAWVEG